MAVTPVYKNNDHVSIADRDYTELQATTRAEIATWPTDGYTVGSEIFCVEDASYWVLDYEGTALKWVEVIV